eukprot:gene9160-6440_t
MYLLISLYLLNEHSKTPYNSLFSSHLRRIFMVSVHFGNLISSLYFLPRIPMNSGTHRVDPICDGLSGIYSVGLHVGAVFVILVSSVVGAGFPMLGKRVPALNIPEYVFVLGKCMGTGVMVAVGFVHLLGDAAQNFQVWCVPAGFKEAYESWAFLLAVVAVVLMHMIDIVIADMVHSWYTRSEASPLPDESLPDSEKPMLTVRTVTECDDALPSTDALHGHPAELESAHSAHSDGASPAFHHQHGVPEVARPKSRAQFVVAAICMEFGTTLHSLFVDLDVGVMNDAKIKPILIALVFHQMFEGLAVGARLVDAEFNLSLELIMMLTFSLSAPLGAAVGTLCVSISETALTGATYVLVSSILDALCGGILVYLGLTLMLTDFPADMKRMCATGRSHATLKKLGLFAGLWGGAAGMCIIGKWC